MSVLSPYSSKFTNVLDEVQDRMSTGELQSFDERKDFIKSKGLDPDEFRKTAIEYDKLMEENPDEIPEGINVDAGYKIVVRRS